MPVYLLDDSLVFPHPMLAEPNGLLAVGGDLERPQAPPRLQERDFPLVLRRQSDPLVFPRPPSRALSPRPLRLEEIKQNFEVRPLRGTVRRFFRRGHQELLGGPPQGANRDLDHEGHDRRLYRAPRPRLCPFRRNVSGREARRGALRRRYRGSFLRRIDVSHQ